MLGILFLAANWGFAAGGIVILGCGGALGWIARGAWAKRYVQNYRCTREAGDAGPCSGYPTVECYENRMGRMTSESATAKFKDPGVDIAIPEDWGKVVPPGTVPYPFRERELQRAGTSVQRETETAVFHRKDGTPVPVRHVWDDEAAKHGTTIAYEELEPMFLDQFLLRYFAGLMPRKLWQLEEVSADHRIIPASAPWDQFVILNAWAKEMPLLFQQLTGYKLNEHQLNNAIAEYARRLRKSAQREAETV